MSSSAFGQPAPGVMWPRCAFAPLQPLCPLPVGQARPRSLRCDSTSLARDRCCPVPVREGETLRWRNRQRARCKDAACSRGGTGRVLPPRQQPPWGFLQRSVAFSALNLGPAGIVVIGNDRMKDTVLW